MKHEFLSDFALGGGSEGTSQKYWLNSRGFGMALVWWMVSGSENVASGAKRLRARHTYYSKGRQIWPIWD